MFSSINFSQLSLNFVIHNLYSEILCHSTLGETILLGDFNTHTRNQSIPIHDITENKYSFMSNARIGNQQIPIHGIAKDKL